jgi:hypothetical protein
MFARVSRAALCAVVATISFVLGVPSSALAYEVRVAPNGAPVHWASDKIEIVLSPSLDRAAPGARDAAVQALRAWAGVSGAPAISTVPGDGSEVPANDGKNTITFAPGGYAPAGNALAITQLTYDDASGEIVDCDIILNGAYTFAVLDDDARAGAGVAAVSTEGGRERARGTFDLLHVFAHETGHALGLRDEPSDRDALMYPFTKPHDASLRSPTSDDLAGVSYVYTHIEPARSSSCAMGRSRPSGATALFAVPALAVLAWRRRRRSDAERRA